MRCAKRRGMMMPCKTLADWLLSWENMLMPVCSQHMGEMINAGISADRFRPLRRRVATPHQPLEPQSKA